MTFNWILYVLWGIPQTLLWFLYIQPRFRADPEKNIPTWRPEFYNDLTLGQWVWHRLLSLDSQMLLPLMMSGIFGELFDVEEGGAKAIFVTRSFAFWTDVEHGGAVGLHLKVGVREAVSPALGARLSLGLPVRGEGNHHAGEGQPKCHKATPMGINWRQEEVISERQKREEAFQR